LLTLLDEGVLPLVEKYYCHWLEVYYNWLKSIIVTCRRCITIG